MADDGHLSVFVFKNLARHVNNSKSTSRSTKTVPVIIIIWQAKWYYNTIGHEN